MAPSQQMTARNLSLARRDKAASSTWRQFPQVMTSPDNRNVEPDHTSLERRAEVDLRSIFIGNLPDDLDSLDREVRNLAGGTPRGLN
ncbi:hypothetical protein PG988_007425 [Apiospora saccharicola]